MTTEETTYRARLRKKGQITLPSELREVLNLEEGDDLLVSVNKKGQVIIERQQMIPPEQAWFWTERWQKMEQEAQADIDAGRTHSFESAEDLITWLEEDADDRS